MLILLSDSTKCSRLVENNFFDLQFSNASLGERSGVQNSSKCK